MINARNLCLGYSRYRNIIQNGNFDIKSNQFVIVTGASGSGKSTLLKSFYGDMKIKSGGLVVNGLDLKRGYGSTIRRLRQSIGIVFQDYKLVSEYNAEENIMLPLLINGYNKKLSTAQAKRLLAHVKLSNKAHAYPDELSGGEQQRVAVARALAHNPKLILADEPTGNLDDYSADVIWKLFKGANEQLGINVVVVTHRVPPNLNLKNLKRLKIDDGAIYEIY